MDNLNRLKNKIEQVFNFRLNKNQATDILRLIHEIRAREKISEENIINGLKKDPLIERSAGRDKFFVLKRNLIITRFPLTSKRQSIDTKDIFLTPLKPALENNIIPEKQFYPKEIWIEKSAAHSDIAEHFQKLFPLVKTKTLNHCWEYAKKNKFQLSELKSPSVFLVSENWDFIKPCPCTKGHLGCNYWILNIGFGCPFDCSYCFLQQYSNFPGIILPANLEDFFKRFNDLYKKLNSPIRIGTGEFCDSLALDHITGYSKQLISFFSDKKVLFELKTKSVNISNLLEVKASDNIVISWSLNPQSIIDSEEINTASLRERLSAAKKVKKYGYTLGFHFDPIIFSDNWESEYKKTIEALYSEIEPGLRWISLGTLRGTRNLKSASELRFPQSNIFYGELLLGKDKKLRYPDFIRKEIYKKMLSWIRKYDKKTPVYLCMEDRNAWQNIDTQFSSSLEIERYLLNKND